MSFPLAGKTAIVTGGAGGIGFAVAQRFAREGASVVLVGRTQKRLEEAFAKLEASVPTTGITPPPKHKFYRLSIEQPKEWEKLAGKYHKTNYLVNCAGEAQRSLLFQLSEEGINEQLAINLHGAIYGARYVGKKMARLAAAQRAAAAKSAASSPETPGGEDAKVEQDNQDAKVEQDNQDADVKQDNKDVDVEPEKKADTPPVAHLPSIGCIINVSSLLAYRAARGTSVYAAAKSGLYGLTASLAHELSRHRIRVNTVVPGYISTNMTKRDLEKQPELVQNIPVGRFGTPDEVADAVLFLVKNEYANNCILNLDGGLSAV